MAEAPVRLRTRSAAPAPQAPVPVQRRTNQVIQAKSIAVDKRLSTQVIKSFESKQIADPFQNSYGAQAAANAVGINTILQPPLSLGALQRLPNENNALRQCIDAMVTNIEGMGCRLEYIGEEGQMDSAEAVAEKERLQNLIDTPNDQYSFIELRERVRRDIETFGQGFIEVTKSQNGEIDMLFHVPAADVRLTAKETQEVEVTKTLRRGGKAIQIKARKRFRRFVQQQGAQKVYFKEFGDPRKIDWKDGTEKASLNFDDTATELVMIHLYTPGEVYGTPRWVNQMPSILGSRESEVTNLNFFRDNAIPALAVLVSGGALSEDAVTAIKDLVNSRMGRDAQHRVIVLEAQGDQQASSPEGTIPAPRIELKSLQNERQSDALFQTYDTNNQKKVRGAFRLPPLLVGFSDDLTYASAETSMLLVESQVFGPERKKVDDLYSQTIFPLNGERLKYWELRSNAPRLTGPTAVTEAIQKLEASGALTANVVIGLANELFDLKIPLVKDEWGDYPYSMVLELAKSGTLKGIDNIAKPEAAVPGGAAKPTAPAKAPAAPKTPAAPTAKPVAPKKPANTGLPN